MTDARLGRLADEIMSSHLEAEPTPGVAWGVVADGRLVHTAGFGQCALNGAEPGPDTVFRIASMTKSFTAATLLALRDDGVLRLDDPVTEHVPELARTFSPRVTLRDLLLMVTGLPTDDPWGDRQQDLPQEQLLELLTAGPWVTRPPGQAYEYSNLGYSVLGLVVERAAREPYRDAVTHRLLAPLAMTRTGYEPDVAAGDDIATGYVRRGTEWVEEPPAGYGAFAPMGGLFSTVRDLATWVVGFLGTGNDDAQHPLARESREEMQRGARLVGADVTVADDGAAPSLRVRSYGYGLVDEVLPVGRTVSHSGGYPGFGSHMRWHPASGLGVVALGNRTYAPMSRVATQILQELVRETAATSVRTPVRPDGRLEDAVGTVLALVAAWDDTLADRWFADNMDRDIPRDLRRQSFRDVAARHGALRADGEPTSGPWDLTVAAGSWWFSGGRGGRVRVDLALSPQRPPLIQSVTLMSVPAAPEPVRAVAAALVERCRQERPGWSQAALGPEVGGDGVDKADFAVSGVPTPAEVVVHGDVASLRHLPAGADIV